MIRAGVRIFKWCNECGKVTEHGDGEAFGMTVQFCKVHRIEPWEGLLPLPEIPKEHLEWPRSPLWDYLKTGKF